MDKKLILILVKVYKLKFIKKILNYQNDFYNDLIKLEILKLYKMVRKYIKIHLVEI